MTQTVRRFDLDFFRSSHGAPRALHFYSGKSLCAPSERIVDAQSGETSEVSISRPQLSDTVFQDECGDMRVVGKVAGGLAGAEELLHENRMSRAFAKQV